MASSVSILRILAMTIEGVAQAGSTDLIRWCTDPTKLASPPSYYLPGLNLWPSELGFSADFRAGTVASGTQTFEVRGHSAIWEQSLRVVHPVTANLTADITKAAVSIDLDTGGLSGVVNLEREAILLGTESPAKTYVATRGVRGTAATAHGSAVTDDTEAFATLKVISGRVITLLAIDDSGESEIWAGTVLRINSPTPDVVVIEGDSVSSLVRNGKLMRTQWRGTAERGIYVPGDTTAKPDAGVLAGTQQMVLANDDGAGIFTYVAYAGGYRAIRSGRPSPFGRSPVIIPLGGESKAGTVAWEILSSSSDAPSNSASPAKNTLPLASNPGVLLLTVLLSTDNGGSPGDNDSTYDTGVANMAGAIPRALVDVAAIEAWTVKTFGSSAKNTGHMSSFHLGREGKPEDLDKVVARILRPFGAVLAQGRAGKLTVASFADSIPWGGTNTIVQSQIRPPIGWSPQIEDAVDSVDVTYSDWPGRDALPVAVQDTIKQRRQLHAISETLEIDAGGIRSLDLVRQVTEQFLIRLHDPIPLVTFSTLRTADYWPGDVVSVTHSLIHAGDGTRGVTAAAMLVIGRTESVDEPEHAIHYELLHVGLLIGNGGKIAPSARVASWSSPVLTLESNDFTQTGYGPFAADVPNDTADQNPWEAGDFIQLCDQYGTVRDDKILIDEVGPDSITIDAATLTGGVIPAATDIVRVSKYDSGVANQRTRWAYVADAAETLGAAGVAGKEYTYSS